MPTTNHILFPAVPLEKRSALVRPGPAHHGGFTLVELIIVTAIIAILMAMLLPSSSKTRVRAQSACCFNNLRQLQLGWNMYETDHNDRFPPNISSYAYTRAQSLSNSWVRGNSQYDLNTTNITAGSLYIYVPSAAAYRCPTDRAMTRGSSALPRSRSYSVDWWLGGDFTVNGQIWTDPNPRGYVQQNRACQITTPGPAKIFVFIDDNEQTIDDGIFVIGGRDWFDYPADRHGRSANLSFLDGHVEHHHWGNAKTVQGDWTYDLNPLWSREVSDHAWLVARIPRN